MKTESNIAFILRLALTLLVVTSVVAAALAGVNSITKDRIAAIKLANTQAAIEAVLPGGGEETAFTDDTGLVSKVYVSEIGYAIEVTPAGFGDVVDLMVGVSHEGQVLGISVIDHAETAGLGAVAAAQTAAGEAFRGQFVGMEGTLAVTKDGGEVDAITGATITSRAITKGVNAAISCAAGMEVAK